MVSLLTDLSIQKNGQESGRKIVKISSGYLLCQFETNPPYGFNRRKSDCGQLSPDVYDVFGNCGCITFPFIAEDVFVNLLLGKDLSVTFGKKQTDVILAFGKWNPLISCVYFAFAKKKMDI